MNDFMSTCSSVSDDEDELIISSPSEAPSLISSISSKDTIDQFLDDYVLELDPEVKIELGNGEIEWNEIERIQHVPVGQEV